MGVAIITVHLHRNKTFIKTELDSRNWSITVIDMVMILLRGIWSIWGHWNRKRWDNLNVV